MAKLGTTMRVVSGGNRVTKLGTATEDEDNKANKLSPAQPRNLRINSESLVFFRYRPPTSEDWRNGPQTLVNPTTIRESVDAQYSLRAVMGLSHEVAQYIRTSSRKLSMELYIAVGLFKQVGLIPVGETSEIDPLTWRNFWQAMCVPFAPGLPPPLLHVNMPHTKLNFYGVAVAVHTEYQQFDYRGRPSVYTINISLVETPLYGLMRTDDVYNHGLGSLSQLQPVEQLGSTPDINVVIGD